MEFLAVRNSAKRVVKYGRAAMRCQWGVVLQVGRAVALLGLALGYAAAQRIP
jgi:hypothetical protein